MGFEYITLEYLGETISGKLLACGIGEFAGQVLVEDDISEVWIESHFYTRLCNPYSIAKLLRAQAC